MVVVLSRCASTFQRNTSSSTLRASVPTIAISTDRRSVRAKRMCAGGAHVNVGGAADDAGTSGGGSGIAVEQAVAPRAVKSTRPNGERMTCSVARKLPLELLHRTRSIGGTMRVHLFALLLVLLGFACGGTPTPGPIPP